MLILTRSLRIKNTLRTVRARIPSKDWQTIDSFLSKIRAVAVWTKLGLSDEINPVAAQLRPLRDEVDFKKLIGAQIIFHLPACRLYSKKAMTGLVAHELAHALRASQIGEGWLEKMGGVWSAPGSYPQYQSEERTADAIASAWGFRAQIRAMREERQKVLNPYIDSQENRILRQIARRDRESEAAFVSSV